VDANAGLSPSSAAGRVPSHSTERDPSRLVNAAPFVPGGQVTALSPRLLRGEFKDGDTVVVDVDGAGALTFQRAAPG
jgi:hypothetical protein